MESVVTGAGSGAAIGYYFGGPEGAAVGGTLGAIRGALLDGLLEKMDEAKRRDELRNGGTDFLRDPFPKCGGAPEGFAEDFPQGKFHTNGPNDFK